jgi:signal transduction histidine kinase
MLIIIAIDGYLSIVREVDLFQANMRSNALMLGNVTEEMFTEIWITEGKARALGLVNDINQAEHKIHLSFIDEPQFDTLRGNLTDNASRLDSVREGAKVSITTQNADGTESLLTFIPINSNNGTFRGALLLTESYDDLTAYTRETLIRVLILSGALVLAGTAMIWTLGRRFVGEPLEHLMERTRQIGRGDFSRVHPLPGHNELTRLSESFNVMCSNLEEAQGQLKQETDKRIAAIEQLRHTERLATVGRLASGVAHELGTPLNVIAGRSKIMANAISNDEEVEHSCRIISEQADRMTKIIKQLLDFARRRRSQRSLYDIRPLIKEIAEILSPMARKSKVSIETNLPDDLPRANIDQSQIQQVLINIVVNGIQAMPEGGQLTIEAEYTKKIRPTDEFQTKKDYVCIEIKDQGEGIPPEIVDKIFDPFFTTKDVGSGTGLGLSISHGIIEEHEGWVDVQSNIGKGTVFQIFLPSGEDNDK